MISVFTVITVTTRPLIIQRKRLHLFFDYEHRFEAYVPKDKRLFGLLCAARPRDDNIVAAIDLRTDREKRKLLVQKWTWLSAGPRRVRKKRIEEELNRLEATFSSHPERAVAPAGANRRRQSPSKIASGSSADTT